jgi:hypothetical protein
MADYWFKPKSFGYGATPANWQGWLFTLGIIVAALACGELARRSAPLALKNLWSFHQAAPFWFALLAGIVVVFGGAYVGYLKTEGGWRWRGLR